MFNHMVACACATMSVSHAFALLAAITSATPRVDGTEFAQLTIQQRVVIRVPIAPMAMTEAAPRPLRWTEKKGPKCLAASNLAGAVVSGPSLIDIYLRGGSRMRAQLDKQCDAIDLRFGFYIRPNPDGQVCADRDTIHARTGGTCEIERFRTLVPER